MGFWEDERCEYCAGTIVEKNVDVPKKVKGRYVFIENVPCGVCTECGTRYYSANVLKVIEEIVRGRRKMEREITVPVYHL